MYNYGSSSIKKLKTCEYKLQIIFKRAIELDLIDISILQGVRSKEEQNKFFENGSSKLQWPHSKHNVLNEDELSNAIDAAPYVNGKISYNYNHCCYLAGIITGLGEVMSMPVRWGGNWDMDGEPITDQDFQDLVHFELLSV